MLLTACFARDGWIIITLTWTLSLAVMGGACLVNAHDCGRMRCYFTGPSFLVMAAASLSYGLRWLPLGPHGWLYLGAVLLAGGGFFGFVPETLWGPIGMRKWAHTSADRPQNTDHCRKRRPKIEAILAVGRELLDDWRFAGYQLAVSTRARVASGHCVRRRLNSEQSARRMLSTP